MPVTEEDIKKGLATQARMKGLSGISCVRPIFVIG
jgi:hypothetical protein